MLTAEVILMNKYDNNNNKLKDLLKKRGFYISLMAGAICVVALTAVYMNSNKEQDAGELRIEGSSDYADNGETDVAVLPEVSGQPQEVPEPTMMPAESKKNTDKTEEKVKKDKKLKKDKKSNDKKTQNTDDAKVAVMESGKGVSNLSFNQEKGIMWPVKGEVIMKFSPDTVVYYKSLGSYKTNPAVVIAAATGSNVSSGTDAVVTDIGENEEIGKYVITSIGDDYKIIYGQLDNIQVKQGTRLKEGEIIGTIAAPTKYYIEEGSNLYLKMICDDQPVDPLIFLR